MVSEAVALANGVMGSPCSRPAFSTQPSRDARHDGGAGLAATRVRGDQPPGRPLPRLLLGNPCLRDRRYENDDTPDVVYVNHRIVDIALEASNMTHEAEIHTQGSATTMTSGPRSPTR